MSSTREALDAANSSEHREGSLSLVPIRFIRLTRDWLCGAEVFGEWLRHSIPLHIVECDVAYEPDIFKHPHFVIKVWMVIVEVGCGTCPVVLPHFLKQDELSRERLR